MIHRSHSISERVMKLIPLRPKLTTTMKFEKKVFEKSNGMQASAFDVLLPEFTTPGETLLFDEADMPRAKASQAAKRLNALDPSRKFHSGWNPVEKKVFIRVRPDGEIPSKEDAAEEKKEERAVQQELITEGTES